MPLPSAKLIETLKGLGLSEAEARVYSASLTLGPATVLQIANAAEVKRTNVYPIIESLKKHGLIRKVVKGLKNTFVAENPQRLEALGLIVQENLKKTLPEFQSLYNLGGNESSVKYYEGFAGVKNVYQDLLKEMQTDDYYLVISEQERWIETDKKFFEKFRKDRADLSNLLNVTVRILLQDSLAARKEKRYEKNYHESIRILPPHMGLTTNLVVTPRKILIHQLVPPITGLVIENRSIIQLHKEMFEMIWASVK